MIYTFWEGDMPAYIKLCMQTWKHDYTMLTHDNLNQYTDLPIDKLRKHFTLPQVADIVRVHVLRDNGGYWLDTDTIMITDELPTENMMGFVEERTNTIGYLYTEAHSDMFEAWANYQDHIIKRADLGNITLTWDIVGNRFTDPYVMNYRNISICDVSNKWAETYMIDDLMSRYDKYRKLYFGTSYKLSDFKPTNMLMLHNSWTPQWYKDIATKEEVLSEACTLSNILREVTK